MTTFTAFDSALSGVSITGVTNAYTYQKLSVHTPDLPASFTRLPGAGMDYGLETCSGNTMVLELVIVLEPLAQGTMSSNHTANVAMMDNIKTAMSTLYTSSLFTWSARIQTENVGEITHWAIVISTELAE